MVRRLQPLRLCPDWVRERYEGMWVAMRDGDVVAARESSMDLAEAMIEQGIRNAYVLRVPRRDDVEIVGLG